ncbi:MAG: hypothetical protein WC400_03750, partial [Patescibacteria group bacterium]
MRDANKFLLDQANSLEEDATFHMHVGATSASTANAVRTSIMLAVIAATVAFIISPVSDAVIMQYRPDMIVFCSMAGIVLTQIQFELEVRHAFEMGPLLHSLAEKLRDRKFTIEEKKALTKNEHRADILSR